jgi:hypothetical protein
VQQGLPRGYRKVHLLVRNQIVGTVPRIEIQQDNGGISPPEKRLRQQIEMQRVRRRCSYLEIGDSSRVGRKDIRRLDRQFFPRILIKGHLRSIAPANALRACRGAGPLIALRLVHLGVGRSMR